MLKTLFVILVTSIKRNPGIPKIEVWYNEILSFNRRSPNFNINYIKYEFLSDGADNTLMLALMCVGYYTVNWSTTATST